MWLKYFIIGILFAGLIHMLLSSSCVDELVNPKEDSTEKQIEESMTKLEEAFLSGDTTKLKNEMTATAQAFYGEDFAGLQSVMAKIGNAMKNRRVTKITELYAEAVVTHEGKEFLLTFARQDDDSWKLIRF